MGVAALIGIMIAIVVGVNLVPMIQNTVNNVTSGENPIVEPGSAADTLLGILPIVFAATIILGAIVMMAGTTRGRRTLISIRLWGIGGSLPTPPWVKEYYRSRSIGLSGEELLKIIGVTGLMTSQLTDNSVTDIEPLVLQAQNKKLWIDTNFEWQIVEKHQKFEMYKMVGLHKKQRGLNCVYIIGKDSHTQTPYILRCPPGYMKSPISECIKWNVGAVEGDTITEV